MRGEVTKYHNEDYKLLSRVVALEDAVVDLLGVETWRGIPLWWDFIKSDFYTRMRRAFAKCWENVCKVVEENIVIEAGGGLFYGHAYNGKRILVIYRGDGTGYPFVYDTNAFIDAEFIDVTRIKQVPHRTPFKTFDMVNFKPVPKKQKRRHHAKQKAQNTRRHKKQH